MNIFNAMLAQSFWLPPSGSNTAESHDGVFYFTYYITLFFFLLVVGLEIFFIIRYRRKNRVAQQDTTAPTHNTPLELTWTLIPLLIVIAIFGMGFIGYIKLDTVPSNAYTIEVEAFKWGFTFRYPNGGQSDVLYVPKDQDIHLSINATDVLHAVYIPAFRISRNAIPRRTTDLWFRATQETGDKDGFHIFCTQYCGDGHSKMHSMVYVLNTAEFNAKLNQLANIFVDPLTKEPIALHEVGAKLYKQSGCSQCHTIDGNPSTGPTWKSLWKHAVKFADGSSITNAASDADWEQYLHQSVLDPGAKIVAGFQNVMPSYANSFSGSIQKDLRLMSITEYIKSLGGQPYTPKFAPSAAPTGNAPQPTTEKSVSATPANSPQTSGNTHK